MREKNNKTSGDEVSCDRTQGGARLGLLSRRSTLSRQGCDGRACAPDSVLGTGCTCPPADPPSRFQTRALHHPWTSRTAMELATATKRCVAATFLPANCGTAPVYTADVISHMDRHWNDDDNKMALSADDTGRLVCVDGHRCPVAGCYCWILSVPLADDCHAYNCWLTLLAGGAVGLHTTVAVPAGQPLRMWFPPDLQLMLHVPFLTPVNIKHERKYVCHECGYTCEKPNPLKIHLALDCGRSPRAKLWSRLRGPHADDRIEASFRFSLTPDPKTPPPPPPPPPSSSDSAFRPYSPESSTSSCTGPTTSPRPTRPLPQLFDSGAQDTGRGGDEVTTFFDRRCAEMETIVSNLGHSEQGHLCIYCGKVYSRKYGLKIHIRTHTGFKPLKCKYCYRPFGDPSNLNKHVRLHAEGDTPYKCDCCGKILVRKRDLDRHMKSRHAQTVAKSLFKMHVPV